MKARLMMLLIAAAAVTAVGCGGDSEGSGGSGGDPDVTTVTTSSLSKDAFLKKANAICARGAFQAVEGEPTDGEPAPKTLPERVEVVMVPAFNQVADELQQLGAPRGDEAEIEAIVAALHEDVDSLEQNSASQKALTKLQYEFESSSALAGPYGLYACAYLKRPRTPQESQEAREKRQKEQQNR